MEQIVEAANEIICNAAAIKVLLENDWNYLTCTRCSRKFVGDDGDPWCAKCEAKVETPISRFLLLFEVEDNTGSAIFLALDSEVQKLITELSLYFPSNLEYQPLYAPVYTVQ